MQFATLKLQVCDTCIYLLTEGKCMFNIVFIPNTTQNFALHTVALDTHLLFCHFDKEEAAAGFTIQIFLVLPQPSGL